MAGFSYTQNRELSWLKFNERVLEEAYADEVPLYERLKFIAIFTSNLDEFFMVRVGSLYDMSLDGDDQIDNKTGLSPSQQLERIYHAVEPLYKKRDRYFREVENALRAYGIADLSIDELKGDDAVFVYDYWRSCVLPVLSPQIVDDHHPFPFVANKVPHVAVELQKKKRTIMGLIPMPAALPSLLFLPGAGHPLRAFGRGHLPLCRRGLPRLPGASRATSSASPATPTSAPRTRSSPPPAISAKR